MSADDRPPLHVVTLDLRNPEPRPLELRLEPWGEVFAMPEGAVFEVKARGPAGDTLEVVWGDGHVTVFGWPGSVVNVLRDGVDARLCAGAHAWPRDPVPRLPEGMRTREWLAVMMDPAA